MVWGRPWDRPLVLSAHRHAACGLALALELRQFLRRPVREKFLLDSPNEVGAVPPGRLSIPEAGGPDGAASGLGGAAEAIVGQPQQKLWGPVALL